MLQARELVKLAESLNLNSTHVCLQQHHREYNGGCSPASLPRKRWTDVTTQGTVQFAPTTSLDPGNSSASCIMPNLLDVALDYQREGAPHRVQVMKAYN
eukprot:4449186-Amphidinium_carterae.1